MKISGGTNTTDKRAVSNFMAIDVSRAIQVRITKGTMPSLTLETGVNFLPYIITEVRQGVLVLTIKDDVQLLDGSIIANVVMPSLVSVRASGASVISSSDTFGATDFATTLTGASQLSMPLTMQSITATIEGASTVRLTGQAQTLTVAGLSGASQLLSGELLTNVCSLNVSGASRAEVNVKKTLSGTVSGASQVQYWGGIVASLHVDASSTVSRL
ncbi:head GIN domain-containing protein [Spirosoma montaniterrae]|uniref:Putative auto-transporter adhesin head GIN domain-containing protein n=1 Tax=Spirosoma montaniterrae TaxID=1178516 RepID=A0A1P9WUA2_9BACT|nr:head GIN domain-containing protein [Spirosoma montaniterrae]AQG78949.1 hypothetical protein AWR27_06175 [Spirosoma montaniterrae]